MKRDMDLLRKILLKLEEDFKAGERNKFGIRIEGYDSETIGEHCVLIDEAGLVREFKPNGGKRLVSYSIGPLNSRGHDYIELIRNEDVWGKTTEMIEEKKLPKTIDNISRVAGTFVGAVLNQILEK